MLTLSACIFLVVSLVSGTFELITDVYLLGNLVGLALVATVLSNVFQVYSIKFIGSTQAAILGAVEPATGVVMCIILFDEVLNAPIVAGIALIFTAVMIVVTRNK
jgi:drug/metabolite transporter (DMT)-like permease